MRSQSTTEARSLVRTGTKTPQRGLTAALHVGDSPSVDRIGEAVEIARVQVNTFPSEDDEFARFAAELVAAASGISDGLVGWLESALRERYPRASVAQRSELADMFPIEPYTLYAYRDGSPLPPARV